jgi:hypothetical protein
MCLRYIHIPKGSTTQTTSFETWNETLIRYLVCFVHILGKYRNRSKCHKGILCWGEDWEREQLDMYLYFEGAST